MTATQLYTILSILFVGGGITVAVWRTLHSIAKKYLGPVMQVVDDWRGDPGRPDEGIPARDGVLKRLTRVEGTTVEVRADLAEFRNALVQFRLDLTTIKNQVTPNGGSSMIDRVNQTLTAVNAQSGPSHEGATK